MQMCEAWQLGECGGMLPQKIIHLLGLNLGHSINIHAQVTYVYEQALAQPHLK